MKFSSFIVLLTPLTLLPIALAQEPETRPRDDEINLECANNYCVKFQNASYACASTNNIEINPPNFQEEDPSDMKAYVDCYCDTLVELNKQYVSTQGFPGNRAVYICFQEAMLMFGFSLGASHVIRTKH